MKGLLYKEWCLGKKKIFSFLGLSLVFCILGVLIFLSMICGNLQYIPKEDPESIKFFAIIFFYMPYIISLFAVDGCNQSICSDYKSGWMTYSYTLPVKIQNAVGVRYLAGGILFFLGFLYGVLNAAMISFLSGVPFTMEIIKNLLFILILAIAIFSLFIPLSMKLKKSQIISTIGGILVIIIYIVSGIFIMHCEKMFGDNMQKMILEKFETIRDIAVCLFPFIVFFIVRLSFVISVKICKRREA